MPALTVERLESLLRAAERAHGPYELKLGHRDEEPECMRVDFKTDRLNEQSRAALQRIGAVEEGTAPLSLVLCSRRSQGVAGAKM